MNAGSQEERCLFGPELPPRLLASGQASMHAGTNAVFSSSASQRGGEEHVVPALTEQPNTGGADERSAASRCVLELGGVERGVL